MLGTAFFYTIKEKLPHLIHIKIGVCNAINLDKGKKWLSGEDLSLYLSLVISQDPRACSIGVLYIVLDRNVVVFCSYIISAM